MRRASALVVVLLFVCSVAMAETVNPYNGEWTATWAGGKGVVHFNNKADVVIRDTGGTFRNRRHSTKNPCIGREAPITVMTATADELIFVIQFASVLKGCKDSEVKLKRVDDKTLKGLRDENKEITLIRE